MTREEQIKTASEEFARGIASIRPELNADSFRNGAEWADKHPNGSMINWQKGTPKKNGRYLVTVPSIGVTTAAFITGDAHDEHFFKEYVTAWCKLSDIEPYKEETK